jgi:hypothetical protein
MQHIKEYKESWVACTLGISTLKRAFCTIILTLVRYLTSSWSIAIFLVWMSTVGTCWLAPVRSNWFAFLTQLLPPSFGHSVIFPHPPCPHARAGKLPSLYGGTYHTQAWGAFLFASKTVDLFYFTQDWCCDLWVTQQYIQYNFFIWHKEETHICCSKWSSVSIMLLEGRWLVSWWKSNA